MTLRSIESWQEYRRKEHELLDFNRYRPRPNGIACPKCSAEMVDTSPNISLTSNPPQKYVHCPACEFSTTVLQ